MKPYIEARETSKGSSSERALKSCLLGILKLKYMLVIQVEGGSRKLEMQNSTEFSKEVINLSIFF